MNELRKDYLVDRWVIIAADRAKRPLDFKKPRRKAVESKTCVFCPSNEGKSPDEVYRYEEGGKWLVRAVRNKFPAVTMIGDYKIDTSQHFFTHSSAYGQHEVIVETPDHTKHLSELGPGHIRHVLDAYVNRINALNDLPGIHYVSIFKNQGEDAGASLTHAHSQVIAYNSKPEWIREQLMACYDYIVNNESCPYCEIIAQEATGPRRAYENNTAVAFCPYASVFPFEVRICPKRHVPNINALNDAELNDFAQALDYLLKRLGTLGNPSFNMVLINGEPKGENFHFHISIMPRLAKWAGFELATGTIINSMPPEQAALFYRNEIRK